jgi:3',5'-cyclic AMP phosphodiesterase CpdA
MIEDFLEPAGRLMLWMKASDLGITRREALLGVASASVGLFSSKLFGAPAPLGSAPKPLTPSEGFRFAHLTDLHILTHGNARKVRRALHHATHRPNPPKLILTGGDLVYDTMYADEASALKQWEYVKWVFESHRKVPVEHVLGNHDIWGIDRVKSKTTGREPLYGKRLAMEALQLSQTYRSFDQGGWHFILLDDVVPLPDLKTYEGRLDETQFEWLESDLKSVPSQTPVIVLTHIPILGASVFFPPQTTHCTNLYSLPYTMMHGDAQRIVALFEQHSNVKLCLSGHTHLVDRVEYKGVTYMGNGAVCGNWWNGPFQGFMPGYSLIDLHPDGSFGSEYQHYC